ncbi:MAG: helicase C-terminal domain-containing protein [Coriobacteriales bacterium]|nr:helicase C-terminal domain-containing protein [Coriobacteriales bacterium]
MRTLRTSVRRLVEFLLRTGDIDSSTNGHGGVEVMQAGSNIHRMLQAAGGTAYQAEVSLACSLFFPNNAFSPHAARLDIQEESVSGQEGFFLSIEGRADGIIDDGTRPLTIDEIKGTTRDVSTIQEPVAVHEAQALCYAYLYLRKTRGPSTLATAFAEKILVRLTYASMDTGEIRQIERTHRVPDIEAWFFSLLDKAQRWYAWRVQHDARRNASLASLGFPFKPRDAQREIMSAVTATIHDGKRLYVQASTGSGKTIATLFPALKALGTGEVARIAFLTAKTMTRGPVLESLELLRLQQLATNTLVMTARDKICPLRRSTRGAQLRSRPLASLCNPHECPLARGHYDAANDALFDLISSHDILDSARVEAVAARHHVCPYELQRDAALWADIIVCDYHYAFAPSASLFGLSDEPGAGDTVFLVDEAHNLPDRMREMYSAELSLPELKKLDQLLTARKDLEEPTKALRAVISAFPAWDKALPSNARSGARGQGGRPQYQVVRLNDEFREALAALTEAIGSALEELLPAAATPDAPDNPSIETYLSLRDTNFTILAFFAALQRAEAGYVTFLSKDERGGRVLKVFCMDPSHDLAERLEQARAAVFFSGTLLPLDYHRKLLAAQEGDGSLYAQSSFDQSHQQVLIGTDVSARFSRRGPELYARVASYLTRLTSARPGNYLVFLPSYAMLGEVAAALESRGADKSELVRQRPGMREDERERFVARFRAVRSAGTSLVGLCVLGGIFGESIDLVGEALVGVVVVGTGMPRATAERELIRDYYDAKARKGFAYAYTYPGMNKVLQAAGRLIRSERDRGVVLLLDDRFLEDELQKAFPKEWTNVRSCTLETMVANLSRAR